MAGWHLDTKMAQDIVARTMRIIDTNINVMDARGRIIGSGDRDRIGELHEGALLVLSQGRVVDIDDAVARHLHGVRQGINLPLRLEGEIVGVIGLTGEPENLRKYGERHLHGVRQGINLPLRLEGEIVGVIGLTGEPENLRKYGELVCMTAEMMLEQSRLMHLLAQDSRLREELVMNLIQAEENTPALTEWAQRLGIDLNQPRVVAIVEVDSGQLGVDSAMAELQQLQNALTTPERNNLVAIVSLTEMVVLKPALNSFGRWDAEDHRKRVEQLITRMKEYGQLRFRVSLGNYFSGPGSIARSYRTAKTTMVVGKQRMPESRCYFYQDLMLPVLLDSLRGDWQANELARPLARLKAMDNNGLLRQTLAAWFRHNVQPLATSKALFIHRNTLEYRLNRISELTGLDLGNFDDRLLLYVALQLDEER
ncbi:CdaR family transcriptional regulator [Escherichia coli]|uniref:CdaR family transcriptional regulator n=3 Tax=Escherichia coli TaxID=562 RepID=UPI001FCE7232|nr:CdaR family transcriptional regulator [Escherichia coli]